MTWHYSTQPQLHENVYEKAHPSNGLPFSCYKKGCFASHESKESECSTMMSSFKLMTTIRRTFISM
jgi:hypothetical protein